jgi:transcription-repair coupling factor (superfamily II helicase)
LEHGFEAPGLTVISEQDVLGDRLIRQTKKRRRAENFLTETQSLSPGDLVVHVDHGVGRYQGMEVVTALGAAHECLLIEYAEGSKLYLPVENIELLSRFGHEEGLLDRLGGGAWQAKKARLKERIRQMAERLIRVAAERALRSAPVLSPPEGMWDQFLARFPYAETDDQLSAIDDVLSDLESGAPMDRLVCGDVGFGKTEVAIRAAFVAAMSGVQVAVIAPTTLLARQHFKGFAERFRGFPLNVRTLSRFVSAKDAADTRDGIAKGTVDIVIGTHALAGEVDPVQEPRPSGHRRRAAFRGAAQGAPQADAHRRPCADINSDAYPSDIAAEFVRRARVEHHRHAAHRPAGDPDLCVSEFDTITVREALAARAFPGRAVVLCGAPRQRPARDGGLA